MDDQLNSLTIKYCNKRERNDWMKPLIEKYDNADFTNGSSNNGLIHCRAMTCTLSHPQSIMARSASKVRHSQAKIHPKLPQLRRLTVTAALGEATCQPRSLQPTAAVQHGQHAPDPTKGRRGAWGFQGKLEHLLGAAFIASQSPIPTALYPRL